MYRVTIFVMLAVTVLTATTLVIWRSSHPTQAVQLTSVELAPLNTTISTNGKIEAERTYEIRAPFSALSRRIAVSRGEQLKKGQEIVSLDNARILTDLAAARSELQAAESELKLIDRGPSPEELNQVDSDMARARRTLETAAKVAETNRSLIARNAISRYEADQSERDFAAAQQAVDALVVRRRDMLARYGDSDRKRVAARIEAARSRIDYLVRSSEQAVVRAPAEGILFHFELRDGAWVNAGDLLGMVADLSRLRVRAFVDEPDLAQVLLGAEVTTRWDASPQDIWKGRVLELPSEVAMRGSRSVGDVLCSIGASRTALLPNTSVDVEIATGVGPQVPVLPRYTVFPDGKTHFVWVIRDGRAARVTIETGRSTPEFIEILSGLSPGDRVIVPGANPITEGMSIRASG